MHQQGYEADGKKSIAFYFIYDMCKSYLLHKHESIWKIFNNTRSLFILKTSM